MTFHNKLFLVFLRDRRLLITVWSVFDRKWTAPELVVPDDRTFFRGIPALFVIGGVLHLLCGADTDEREILGFRFDYISGTWSQCDDVSRGSCCLGC